MRARVCVILKMKFHLRISLDYLAKHAPLKHLLHSQLQASNDVALKIDKELERCSTGDDVQIANQFRHSNVKAASSNEQQFCIQKEIKKDLKNTRIRHRFCFSAIPVP